MRKLGRVDCYFLNQCITVVEKVPDIAQKMKFSIKYVFSKCDQIYNKLRIWSHLLNKPLIENFIFCAVPISSWSLFKKKAPQLNEKWNILRTLRNKNLFQETQICFPIYISKIKYSGICSSFMAKVHIM